MQIEIQQICYIIIIMRYIRCQIQTQQLLKEKQISIQEFKIGSSGVIVIRNRNEIRIYQREKSYRFELVNKIRQIEIVNNKVLIVQYQDNNGIQLYQIKRIDESAIVQIQIIHKIQYDRPQFRVSQQNVLIKSNHQITLLILQNHPNLNIKQYSLQNTHNNNNNQFIFIQAHNHTVQLALVQNQQLSLYLIHTSSSTIIHQKYRTSNDQSIIFAFKQNHNNLLYLITSKYSLQLIRQNNLLSSDQTLSKYIQTTSNIHKYVHSQHLLIIINNTSYQHIIFLVYFNSLQIQKKPYQIIKSIKEIRLNQYISQVQIINNPAQQNIVYLNNNNQIKIIKIFQQSIDESNLIKSSKKINNSNKQIGTKSSKIIKRSSQPVVVSQCQFSIMQLVNKDRNSKNNMIREQEDKSVVCDVKMCRDERQLIKQQKYVKSRNVLQLQRRMQRYFKNKSQQLQKQLNIDLQNQSQIVKQQINKITMNIRQNLQKSTNQYIKLEIRHYNHQIIQQQLQSIYQKLQSVYLKSMQQFQNYKQNNINKITHINQTSIIHNIQLFENILQSLQLSSISEKQQNQKIQTIIQLIHNLLLSLNHQLQNNILKYSNIQKYTNITPILNNKFQQINKLLDQFRNKQEHFQSQQQQETQVPKTTKVILKAKK